MKKILIAEDDNFLTSAYKVKLKREGFDVQVAGDGEQALLALKTFIPDIILLDLVMPIKDGFAVLEEVKKDPNLKDIPVVVMSNLGQKEDIDRARALGAREYFIKTDIQLKDMAQKIKALLDK
ncbi:MAG: Response regulator receiver protein [Candidatus Nomurabacteria bacterium GW2011_GWA1_46_11]|uniref:Response regulator receiver protein n=1 Tax=Candidatus Nomurabacteria bacterium GW2011_GWA1_46_11 TaxID=1618732 RepID=A0A0G1NJT1_9BACT|nr:MAG: Response regulator receiver protein [Microgenomates group bacterium GW2011_GWA2_44_7]KKT76930.1 MAG: Response regulator receiver protein [Microgenomates group bacterium GW2011_GWB1_44_8]KKU20849.1 MAG: Response regulator receiver protein [Candidatus Nomurabacteria bacterium GW2011_GWA1_46_11]